MKKGRFRSCQLGPFLRVTYVKPHNVNRPDQVAATDSHVNALQGPFLGAVVKGRVSYGRFGSKSYRVRILTIMVDLRQSRGVGSTKNRMPSS
jgi:hypothetical protein